MKLTKELLEVDLRIYWIDFILSSLVFIVCFVIAHTLHSVPAIVIGSIFLYRAGAFTHEIAHQYGNPKIKIFKLVWDYTLGCLILQPSIRFWKPHKTHHTTGIFSTVSDPQYPLVRTDLLYGLFIYSVLPWILPIYNFFMCCFTCSKHSWLESILYKKVYFTGAEYREINRLELQYVLVWISVFTAFPKVVLTFYFMSVLAWLLSVIRIPLEHGLKEYKKTSTYIDQRLDSYTNESPLFIPVQPLALRFHTAHHMFSKVPYHNLKKLHKILKEENPNYTPAASP